MRLKLAFTHLLLACTLSACTPLTSAASSPTPPPTLTVSALPTQTPLAPSAAPSQRPTASATPRPPTATPLPVSGLCSPLEGIALSALAQPDLLKNPFDPPRAGKDGGHQGIDLAYWSLGERKTMQGHPLLSVLDGKVAAALPLRQPYGYAVIVETRLTNLPPGWLSAAPIPTPAPTVPPDSSLYCPPGSEVEALSAAASTARFPEDYSLYLLYAHLDQPATVQLGQNVACGQMIGAAGTTGNSVNIHLHLETRLGPAGATFTSMDHYDNAATAVEMSNYCAWRVSGLFQLFDPLQLLALK